MTPRALNSRGPFHAICLAFLSVLLMNARMGLAGPSSHVPITPDWAARIGEEISRSEYQIAWQPRTDLTDVAAAYSAPNRAQSFRTFFTTGGLVVVPRAGDPGAWRWGLTLTASGRLDNMVPVASSEPCIDINRVEFDRDQFTEWYINSEKGLKQGFTIHQPIDPISPFSAATKMPLRLSFSITGSLHPNLVSSNTIIFSTPAGADVIRLAELAATDATGKDLPVWFETCPEDQTANRSLFDSISIILDDRGAVYPVTIDPLATSANWTVEGNQAGAELGFSVATAGDVNGDGYSDVIVGAPYFDNGQHDEGRVFVYLGTPAGLTATPTWTAEGNLADCRFGESVATAGDVNGDGFADVIIGAGAFTNTAMHEGRAFVFYGSASGPSATPNWYAESQQDSSLFASSVASAGDVNGDGYSDVIVGAPYYDGPDVNAGRAFIWYGSAAGLGPNGTPANADWSFSSDQSASLFGYSVATAGDVNGDGFSDVIIGARLYDNGQVDEGRAYVFQGSATGPSMTPNWTAEGNQAEAYFGFSVATAGDVNGDGYADVIVGAPYYDNGEVDEGRAFVFLGSSTGLAISPAWTTESNQAGSLFGASVSTAGDINGDGYADVVVGAYSFSNDQSQEGRAFAYMGGPAGLSTSPAWMAEGDSDTALFGFCVATAGDVNGDGFSDLIVGSIYFGNGQAQEGRASVFHGSPSGLSGTAGWSNEGNQNGAAYGFSVATAGDVNGDGYSDVLVGAPLYDNGEADQGRVFLYYGTDLGLSLTAGWTCDGDQAGAQFGSSAASAGDVNSDGYDDIIIGASHYSNGEVHEGAAFVFHGGPGGPSLTSNWHFESNQSNALLGTAVSTAGDVNGDGIADVIIGAPGFNNGEIDEGRAFVFQGSPTGLSITPNWFAESDQAGAEMGSAAATAGDVNGDGFSDVIIGSHRYDNGQSDEGAAFVWLGSAVGLGPNGTPANADWTAQADQANAEFGISVATAGDVNGDGYSDVIVGASNYSNGESNEGAAFVWYGSSSGLGSNGTPSNADWSAEANQVNAHFGIAVGSAGDINADGFNDIVIGAAGFDDNQIDQGRAYVYEGTPAGLITTPSWTAQVNQAGAKFGISVAAAGDVNGDGYADVIVGAAQFDNENSDEGSAFLYYGNASAGISLRPQQRRADNTRPIASMGLSDAQDRFRLAATGRTPFGRSRVRMQWEVKPFGVALDGTGLQQNGAWIDTGLIGTVLNEQTTGLFQGNLYHWRLRIRYDTTRSPFQPASRWLAAPFNGREEADVRMSVPPPHVTSSPINQVFCAHNGPASFSITASGAVPLSFQWRKDTVQLSNVGRISGATSPMLTVAAPLESSDSGNYDCVVTNTLGSDTSNAAALTVWPTGTGDVNLSGSLTIDDIAPFVAALISGSASQGNCAADMNGDGRINGADITLFVDLLAP